MNTCQQEFMCCKSVVNIQQTKITEDAVRLCSLPCCVKGPLETWMLLRANSHKNISGNYLDMRKRKKHCEPLIKLPLHVLFETFAFSSSPLELSTGNEWKCLNEPYGNWKHLPFELSPRSFDVAFRSSGTASLSRLVADGGRTTNYCLIQGRTVKVA